MKSISCFLVIILVLTSVLNSCKKETIINNYTDTLILPSNPSITGTTTIAGDTTLITIDGITIHYYSTSPCLPSNEVFYFWATAPGLPANTKLNWYFGDGNSVLNDSLGVQVANAYNSGGIRTLIMQVSINGTIVTTITTSVKSWGQNVTPFPVSFSAQTYDVNDPNKVSFNASAGVGQGSIIRYQWDFNDGASDSTSMPYHEHYFPIIPKDMKYNVKLTAISNAGCKDTTSQIVDVAASHNLHCNFTYKNSNPCKPNTEQTTFTADTTGVPIGVKYFWNLSDGEIDSTSNYSNIHSYVVKGTKPVLLTIKLNGRILCALNKGVTVNGSSATPDAYITQVQRLATDQYFFNSSCTVLNSVMGTF